MQKLPPSEYAKLDLADQWIEDEMQKVETAWIVNAIPHAKKVLELGHGSGIVATALRDAGKEVTIVEGAAEYIGKIDGVQYVHSMFEDFEPIGGYDCVIASFVLEHVADPVALLKRATRWAPILIAVVGNAESWHRRLAVEMGIQPALESLSARDHAVGHYRVYDRKTIHVDLSDGGWDVKYTTGIMFKPLPNSMLVGLDKNLIRAMCEISVSPMQAANIAIYAGRK